MSAIVHEVKVVSSDNISKLTTYELRQELVRRGAFDFTDEDTVNYKTLMQRLMIEVLKDEERAVQEKEETRIEAAEVQKSEAMKLREQRKQEAIERSRLRQQNKEYFAEKGKINEEVKQEKQQKIKDRAIDNTTDTASSVEIVSEETNEVVEDEDSNPFRSNRRFKVAVK